MKKILIVLTLVVAAFGHDHHDHDHQEHDKTSEEKESRMVNCFESHGLDAYKIANETRECITNTMKADKWEEQYCRNYEKRIFPECFSDDFISTLKECMNPDDFQDLQEKIHEHSSIICIKELKLQRNPQSNQSPPER